MINIKKALLSFILLAYSIITLAQISSYGVYDNFEDAVFLVEEMSQDEIKIYNQWVKQGISNDKAVVNINAIRAYTNLKKAPATIIKCSGAFCDEDINLLQEYGPELDAMFIYVYIINSTPKTIKEITLYFRFEYQGKEIYDINTGEKYCILRFQNLSGRTESSTYAEIGKTIFNCYHSLGFNDAVYKQTFHNKLADAIFLDKVEIKYSDGTTSNKAACFEGDYLFEDGPLKPLCDAINYFKNKH